MGEGNTENQNLNQILNVILENRISFIVSGFIHVYGSVLRKRYHHTVGKV